MKHKPSDDLEAAVPPSSDDSVSARMRAGYDEGLTKLQLSYKGAALYARYKAGLFTGHVTAEIAALEEKRQSIESRKPSFPKSFFKAALGKGASFAAENSAVLGATFAGTVIGGPWVGVPVSAAMTYPQMLGGALLEEMREGGYNLSYQDQIYMALEDDAFMKRASRRAHIYAAKMSGGVLLAGAAAGYVYRLVAQPAATMARSLVSSFAGAVKTEVLSELLAEGVRSAANSAGKKIFEAMPARSLFASAAVCKIECALINKINAKAADAPRWLAGRDFKAERPRSNILRDMPAGVYQDLSRRAGMAGLSL